MYAFNPYAIPNFVVAIWIFLVGFLIFLKKRESLAYLAYFGAVAWIFGCGMAYFAQDDASARFWLKIVFSGITLIAPTFYHFTTLFLNLVKKEKAYIVANYLISFIFVGLTVFTDILIYPKLRFWGYYPYAGNITVHLCFLAWFSSTYMKGLYNLFKEMRKSEILIFRKLQIKYLIWTYIFAFLGGIDFLPDYGINFYPFGYLLTAFGTTITAYAILRYKLLDINVALTRAGIFAIVYALVLGIPFWLGYVTKSWLPSTTLAVLLATLGPFIYTSLRRQAENRLLAEDLKKYDTLKKFARTMGLVRDLDKLVRLIVYRLVKTLKVSYGAIYLFDEEEKVYALKSSRIFQGPKPLPSTNSIPEDNDFIRFLQGWHKDLLYEDVQRLMREEKPNNRNSEAEADNRLNLTKVTSRMQELNACLVIPHFLERELIGFLVLGSKLSGRPYSEADIEVLTTLSRSASLAIMNAVFMIELKKTEGELAETHRVAQLGYLASSTGHQISNVLNNIAAIASGLSDSDPILNSLKTTPEALSLFEKHIQDIFTNVEDGGMIIRELRDYAQAESDKKFIPISLKEVLDKTLKVLYIQANKFQSVDISINIAEDVPPVLGSFVQLQNVFVNMLNNAYDAILEKRYYLKQQLRQDDYRGRIEINITRVKGNIHIHIIDDGKGIPVDVLKRLFTPLYTTKASSDKRKEQKTTGGTGIGLYTILVIVKNHGGAIKVERTENLKGSDFLIQLPIPKEGDIPKGAGL
jgi:signal transduction histidine kinase